MEIGAQVSVAGGVVTAFDRADALGVDSLQIFALSPRQWRTAAPPEGALRQFRERARSSDVVRNVFCHASYLINLATGNDVLRDKSFECLVDHLAVATGLGAEGVVLHIGSHLGAGIDAVMDRMAEALVAALEHATMRAGEPSCKIILENTAGAGGTIGRTFQELASIIDATGGDERLGICIDTQHLFASGVAFSTFEECEGVIEELRSTVGLSRLSCLHLNDSKVAFGTNRDRHENLGEGAIGASGLELFLSHPAIGHAPALLEVPGDGNGPRAKDVEVARRILASGVDKRADARTAIQRPPR